MKGLVVGRRKMTVEERGPSRGMTVGRASSASWDTHSSSEQKGGLGIL